MIFVTVSISIIYFEGKTNFEEKLQIPTIFLLICISWRKCANIYLLMYIVENYYLYMLVKTYLYVFLFLSGFSFTDTDDSQSSREREGTIVDSTLPLPPAHEHSDIYLQLCMWGDYHVFLIASLVFTRLLLNEIDHLIELLFDWLID